MQDKPLKTMRIAAVADLEPYLAAWRGLAGPMRSPEWLLSWWEVYATADDVLCILLLHDPEGALVGLAPLYLRKVGQHATFRILGAGDSVSHHADWICADGWETRVGIEVGRFLLECQHGWKRLLFESIDADAEALHATLDFLGGNGCPRHDRPINSCWKIELPPTWDAYTQSLSKSLRKRCRKLQRQFFDSGRIQIRQVASAGCLQKGMDILLNLHAARWGTTKAPLGVFNDRKFREFHEKVSGRLLTSGNLRLAWLECSGVPIAIEYQFVDSEAVYAYQAGIDLSMNEYSPGKLSMMAAIQYAILKGCRFFDLLGGDEPYKANWRAVPVARHDHRVWRSRRSGWWEWSMWSAYTLAAGRLKLIIPPRLIHYGLKKFTGMKNAWGSILGRFRQGGA